MDESRYREVEERLWKSVGVTPSERRIRIAQAGVEVRVQEVGQGDPILFLHGAPISGTSWAWLVAQLREFRCLIVDRPGTGLSDAYSCTKSTLPVFADQLVADVLDGLDVRRAHLVGSSFGGYCALRSAAATPDRVRRMVLVGCPFPVPGMRLPPVSRLMTLRPFRRLIEAVPWPVGRVMLHQLGHGPSLRAGRIPPELLVWYLALLRWTDTMGNDGEMLGSIGSFTGVDASLTPSSQQLRSVKAPTMLIWGTAETFGTTATAQQLVDLLPAGRLVVIGGSGHLPQLDAVSEVAQALRSHLGISEVGHADQLPSAS